MKITLISPYPDITSFGIRTISSYLRKNGYKTEIFFLPDIYGDKVAPEIKRYKDSTLDKLVVMCEDSQLIGITLMTNYVDAAVQITDKLKSKLSAPVIWGGVHPTICPEDSLNYADIVCIGDGEDAILDLAKVIASGGDYSQIKNLCFRKEGKIIKNPVRPLNPDIDIYPMPDYSMEGHFAMFDDSIRPLTFENIKLLQAQGTVSIFLNKIGYQTMTGRGCPHKCTYCINDSIKNLYSGQNYLRWRSTEHIINELSWVREHMPYVEFIWFSDDSFLGRSLKSLEDLCGEYRGKIGLPFYCLASPLTVSEEKIKIMVDSGLIYLQMGIETGSKRIQEIFNREKMSNEKMLNAMKIINKYKDRMLPPAYDIILDVPYETDENKIETLRFISEIPKPFRLQPFSLVIYPGTKLYQMAKADGFISDEKRQIYGKSYYMRESSYLNLLMMVVKRGWIPPFLLKLLISVPVVTILNSSFVKPVLRILDKILRSISQMLERMSERKKILSMSSSPGKPGK